MEKATATKPPWLSPQWQRRVIQPWPEQLQFATWSASSPPDLHAAKERISILEATKRWELVKKMVNPYEMVYTHEDSHFHPSISVIKPLSRSYFKMIEIMEVLQFFEKMPKQTPKIRTAHVAEGPGGFIQAVADLVDRNKKILQQATAMTLKPTDQNVPGWRRAASFLYNHKEVRLHYGADGTGDIYEKGNQNSFVEFAQTVNLFTADGGFDFSINYDIQEQRVYLLLVCSAMTGLRCLNTDGSFVLKLFDILSDSTIILVALMSRCFKEWTLYKPALSRPCNSERYFLGRGFKGFTPAILASLNKIQEEVKKGLYPTGASEILAPEELAYIKEHIHANMIQQISAICIAEKYAKYPEEWYSTQLPRDFETSLRWCQKFRVPFIITEPIAVRPVVYTSEPGVAQQSRLLDDDSSCPPPSVLALPALSEDLSGQTLDQSQCQINGGNHAQTPVVES
jgi:23S rRNA U2552 (ribose-2'-O)-methylase RlmE/FtsJ